MLVASVSVFLGVGLCFTFRSRRDSSSLRSMAGIVAAAGLPAGPEHYIAVTSGKR
jgi:hypothetical protein